MDTLNILVRSLHVVFVIFLVGAIAPSHIVAGTARRAGDPKMALGIWAAWFRIGKVSSMAAIGMIVTGVTLSFTMRYGFFPSDHVWLAMKQAVMCIALVVVAMLMGPSRKAEKAVQEALNQGGGLTDEVRALIKKPANFARILDTLAFVNLVLALWRPGE